MMLSVQDIQPDIGCPLSIVVTERPLAPSGFVAREGRGDRPLRAVRVFVGDPSNRVELAPAYVRSGNSLVQKWDDLPAYRTEAEPITVQCDYGGISSIQRAVHDDVQNLSVTSEVTR